MNNIEEQFRTCIILLQSNIEWNDVAWDTFQYIIRNSCYLSETFLREMKDVLMTSVFNELIINQQLSIDFAREMGII